MKLPKTLINALKVVIDLARENALTLEEIEVNRELDMEYAKQQSAIELIEDYLLEEV